MTLALPILSITKWDIGWLKPGGLPQVNVQSLMQFDFVTLLSDPKSILIALPVAMIFFRLSGGFAIQAMPGGEPNLKSAWRRGRGLAIPILALVFQVMVMIWVATLVFVLPSHFLLLVLDPGDAHPLRFLVEILTVGLTLFYSFLLSVLFQLALHSLVQNRRGVGSAVLHAWRLAKNDPLATVRAALVESVLHISVFMSFMALYLVIGENHKLLFRAVAIALLAFTGCTRCFFWAQAYRGLGGISTAETRA